MERGPTRRTAFDVGVRTAQRSVQRRPSCDVLPLIFPHSEHIHHSDSRTFLHRDRDVDIPNLGIRWANALSNWSTTAKDGTSRWIGMEEEMLQRRGSRSAAPVDRGCEGRVRTEVERSCGDLEETAKTEAVELADKSEAEGWRVVNWKEERASCCVLQRLDDRARGRLAPKVTPRDQTRRTTEGRREEGDGGQRWEWSCVSLAGRRRSRWKVLEIALKSEQRLILQPTNEALGSLLQRERPREPAPSLAHRDSSLVLLGRWSLVERE